mmetsp:Transcript_34456/g.75704  ORF Transcript_34456/g.75704 Transcript_34456/m.75704 type:complete len:207 (-) Transcript_34456:201-821(-)
MVRGREAVADESDVGGREEGPVLHRRGRRLGEDAERADGHAQQPVVRDEGIRLLLGNLVHGGDVHDHVDEAVHVALPYPVVARALVVPVACGGMDLHFPQPRRPDRVRVVGEEGDEGLLVGRRVRADQREHQLGDARLRVVPEPEEDDDHIEIALAHELAESLGRRPFIEARRFTQPLAQLVLLKVGNLQDRGKLLRLWLPHLGRR